MEGLGSWQKVAEEKKGGDSAMARMALDVEQGRMYVSVMEMSLV